MKWGLALLVVAVYLLHQDYWQWTEKSLVFGFLPIGLAYHAFYAVLAAIVMGVLVRYAWPHELEKAESVTPDSPIDRFQPAEPKESKV